MSKPPPPLTYADAGVDIDAGNALIDVIKPLAASTKRAGADTDLGGFGGNFDLKAAGFNDPVLVSGTDGVGTKLKVAIETGLHDTIGIDLVAMCVNDILAQGAEPLYFLDYFATGKLESAVATQVIAGIAEGCRQAGCALIGGETAEMPGMYAPGHYDLAGFATGAAERGRLLPRKDEISTNDRIVTLASSGPHANGYSLIRKIVEMSGLSWQAPAPFAKEKSLAEALLTPTRIYCDALLPSIRKGTIKGLAHITGGGVVENPPRMLPAGLAVDLDADNTPLPPVFDWLAKTGSLAPYEVQRTFNCGIGMMVVLADEDVPAFVAAMNALGLAPRVLNLVRQERP